MNRNRKIGLIGEKYAKTFFENRGFEIIAQNVHTQYGEIDLIVSDKKELIFVEVKTRTNLAFGYPETSISLKKTEHLISSAELYLQDHPEISLPWRIDVLAINLDSQDHEPHMEWFENAID